MDMPLMFRGATPSTRFDCLTTDNQEVRFYTSAAAFYDVYVADHINIKCTINRFEDGVTTVNRPKLTKLVPAEGK
jgi:hypothetical protein